MNIVCIGGGPAGLYAALLLKKQNPLHHVTVIERGRPDDSFGWGVLFSDHTLANLEAADAPSARAILRAFNHWDQIEIDYKGSAIRSGGHGFCGIGRARLLHILQQRCAELGVAQVFQTEVGDDRRIARAYRADLVLACDGMHSALRARYAASYLPESEPHGCRFVWLATRRKFDAFTFAFRQTGHGWFQAHIYQYDGDTSSFIVEAPEAAWRSAGLDRMSEADSVAFCERLFADQLQGHALLSKPRHARGSAAWGGFPRIACRNWVHWNGAVPVVLLGDAAHSAHFSIGSGTRLALEDAIELARCCAHQADLAAALAAYQAARALAVRRLQGAARQSAHWFEHVARHSALEPAQFAYALLTRSGRLSHENLRLRDPAYLGRFEAWLGARAAAQCGLAAPAGAPAPPLLTPFRLRGLVLHNRIAVAPMAQYSAHDGLVGDYHLVHLGARALGGAALLMTEMTAVSAEARITPRCAGLYAPAHTAAWRRIVDFVHAESAARIALQLGHAGPKGATRPPCEGADLPLADDAAWPLLAASDQQYRAGLSRWARAAGPDDLARIEADFVRATLAAAAAGFDWLELHCAHGYLLSSFISPLTNRRVDAYGGGLENRCRFPLRVFGAMRAAWPAARPMSVRISAHDWVEGGTTADDAVRIAALFKDAGADLISVSSGQVSPLEQPAYGRLYQVPFAERVRNEAGIATMAAGAIGDADQANGIIGAGRADLCAVGRPHLLNPAWTLSETARFGAAAPAWPAPYLPARPLAGRPRPLG